jgi:hypothetical protein
MTTQSAALPSRPLPRRFARYVLSFGVSVGVGLAPFLGKVKVPGFDALLEVLPQQLQTTIIPLSAFLMGLVAVAIQFYLNERIGAGNLRRYFQAGFIAMVLSFFMFVVLYRLFVVRVTFDKGRSSTAVVVTPSRLEGCGCLNPLTKKPLSDYDCVRTLSFDPGAHASCWGGTALKARELSLMIPYLFLTSGFGGLIGLLILKEERQRQRKVREQSASKKTGKRARRSAHPKQPGSRPA